jgi:hypothetical protein
MRTAYNKPSFARSVNGVLINCRCAYRVIDDLTIVPLVSDAEATTVQQAFLELSAEKFTGAKTHLSKAASHLTTGDFADSIRESIHAVDAVARKLAPNANDLGPALSALQEAGYIHKAMKAGFSSLYGYASNEKGIRHALVDDSGAKVTEADAIYMFGSCAAFVTYLIAKAKEFGIPLA